MRRRRGLPSFRKPCICMGRIQASFGLFRRGDRLAPSGTPGCHTGSHVAGMGAHQELAMHTQRSSCS